MKNKKHLVAFLDILGFKKLIEEHFSGKDKQSLIVLKKTMKDAENFAISNSKRYLKQYKIKISFKQFSDCVCVSMPLTENYSILESSGIFFNVIRLYQLILLDNNILIRGGVSIGGHFENSNIIFSDALVKSYKLESQSAIYPRILIDNELLCLIQKNLIEQTDEAIVFSQFYGGSLIKDWDDEVFISPFGIIDCIKDLTTEFVENIVQNMLDDYSTVNKLETNLTTSLNEMNKTADFEKETIISILSMVNVFLEKNIKEKHEILLKYKWLRQFIIWNLTPNESQIKFTKFLQNNYKLT